MLSRGQILLSFEHLIRDVDAYIDNFKFDWEKARAGVAPLHKDSPADLRERWGEHLKRTLSPMFPPTAYLPGLLDKVKLLLADTPTPSGPSLERILKLRFPKDDPDRCVKSLRVVKAELIKAKGNLVGSGGEGQPRAFDRTAPKHGPYSKADHARFFRIGRTEIEHHTNVELWMSWKRDEKKRNSDITQNAFRASVNRIRKEQGLPTSSALHKKK